MGLKNYQIPVSVSEGLFYLENLKESTQLLGFYQHYFPNEWQESSPQIQTTDIWKLVQQFFSLVNQHLFPLILEEIEDDSEDYLTTIPYYPCGWDWYFESPEDWTEAELFLLCICQPKFVQKLAEKGEQLPNFPLPTQNLIDHFDWEQFQEICQAYSPPLCYLANVINLITHSTGTIWLDTTADEYWSLDWSAENIDNLTEHWQIASNLITQKQELCQWLSTSPQHYQEVINFLENHLNLTPS